MIRPQWINRIIKLQKAGKVLTPQQKLHEKLDQIMAFNVEAKFNITYDKQGGVLKAQRGSKPFKSATAKSYFSGLKDYLLHQTKSFIPSQYKPTKGSNIQQQYYTRPGLKEEVILNLFGGTDSNAKGPLGENYFYKDFEDAYNTLLLANESRTTSNGTLGRYGVSAGIDDKGRYISFIDNFDHVFIPGKGIPIYDRIYEDEIKSLYNPNLSALSEGDWITRAPELKRISKSKYKLNKGGILKGQRGILTPWYKAYNSKFGRGVRTLMFGKDYDLPDEEYVQKHGYAKPITGTGMLPGKTSMNAFEGIENLVKGSFGTGAKYNAGQQIMKTNAISKTVQPKTASNWDKFLKKSLDEQNKIVKYWDERYSTMRQLQANQKQFKRFVNWINKQ